MSVGTFILVLIGMFLGYSIIDRILKLIENRTNATSRIEKNKKLYKNLDRDIDKAIDEAFEDIDL